MIELYNALKIITLLFLIQKILTFNLGVAFLKSVSIHFSDVLDFDLWPHPLAWTLGSDIME